MEREEVNKIVKAAFDNLARKHWMHIQKLQDEVYILRSQCHAYERAFNSLSPEVKAQIEGDMKQHYAFINEEHKRRAKDATPVIKIKNP